MSRSYPFLLAVIPVLRLVADYPGWAELADVAVIVAVVLTSCGLVYGLVLLATRRRNGRLAALVLLGAVVAFWGYTRVETLVEHRTGLSHPVLLPLWTAATVGGIWWLARRLAVLDRAETFLSLTGGILIGWYVLSIGVAQWRSAGAVRKSGLVQRLAQPIPVRPGARGGPRPDIYLIVLDEYANAEVTGHLFGFDNRPFLDSLRRLGFVVPAVHSNYLHTFLSLPSLLNAAQVAVLSDELGRRSLDRTVPDYLVQHNRTVSFLKSQGYRFAFFPSLSWEATRHSSEADLEFHVSPASNPAGEVTGSGLRQVLVKTSLLKFVDWGSPDLVRGHVRRTFAGIARMPEVPGPVFTFAHVLNPHGPYLFDRACRPAPPRPRGGGSQAVAAAYVEQVQCLDRMVLELVTGLLRGSDLPPIILLQGDHGSKSLHFDTARDVGQISLAAAKERVGAFGAYYLPGPGRGAFEDSVTVVNVMGNVLRSYFGATLPPEPDDMYLSVDAAPLAFKRVDFGWLARQDWSAER
jgi:hypothetical protein